MVLLIRVDVPLGKLALFQKLAHVERQLVAVFCRDLKGHEARNILPKIQHRFAGGRRDQRGLEGLMLGHGNIVGSEPGNWVCDLLRPSAVGWHHPGVHGLAHLIVGKAALAVIRPLPILVRANGRNRTRIVRDFKLQAELGLAAVLRRAAVGTEIALVPASGELRRQLVLAVPQQPGHIVGLHLHPLCVIRRARRQHGGTDLGAVDRELINAAGCGVKPHLFDILYGKPLAEAVHGSMLSALCLVVPGEPLCSPVLFIK